jgi:hypothetical protein
MDDTASGAVCVTSHPTISPACGERARLNEAGLPGMDAERVAVHR